MRGEYESKFKNGVTKSMLLTRVSSNILAMRKKRLHDKIMQERWSRLATENATNKGFSIPTEIDENLLTTLSQKALQNFFQLTLEEVDQIRKVINILYEQKRYTDYVYLLFSLLFNMDNKTLSGYQDYLIKSIALISNNELNEENIQDLYDIFLIFSNCSSTVKIFIENSKIIFSQINLFQFNILSNLALNLDENQEPYTLTKIIKIYIENLFANPSSEMLSPLLNITSNERIIKALFKEEKIKEFLLNFAIQNILHLQNDLTEAIGIIYNALYFLDSKIAPFLIKLNTHIIVLNTLKILMNLPPEERIDEVVLTCLEIIDMLMISCESTFTQTNFIAVELENEKITTILEELNKKNNTKYSQKAKDILKNHWVLKDEDDIINFINCI